MFTNSKDRRHEPKCLTHEGSGYSFFIRIDPSFISFALTLQSSSQRFFRGLEILRCFPVPVGIHDQKSAFQYFERQSNFSVNCQNGAIVLRDVGDARTVVGRLQMRQQEHPPLEVELNKLASGLESLTKRVENVEKVEKEMGERFRLYSPLGKSNSPIQKDNQTMSDFQLSVQRVKRQIKGRERGWPKTIEWELKDNYGQNHKGCYQGELLENEPNGLGKFIGAGDFLLLEGEWAHGQLNGKVIEHYPDCHCQYEARGGKFHGKFIWYQQDCCVRLEYLDGRVQEG